MHEDKQCTLYNGCADLARALQALVQCVSKHKFTKNFHFIEQIPLMFLASDYIRSEKLLELVYRIEMLVNKVTTLEERHAS